MGIQHVLSRFGFERLDKGTFRHSSSSPSVEHFIFLDQASSVCPGIDFGFRHPVAEEYAFDAFAKFNTLPFFPADTVRPKCAMRFSFLRFVFQLEAEWRLDRYVGIVQEENLARDLSHYYLPFVASMYDCRSLQNRLQIDAEPCPWVAVNGALRAAQLAWLTRTLKSGEEGLVSLLHRHEMKIRRDLGPNADWDMFVSFLLR